MFRTETRVGDITFVMKKGMLFITLPSGRKLAYEPAPAESVEHQVLRKIEYEEIRARMDAEDPRIALAFEGKELYGQTVQEIADELGVSAPRVYQLIARAREIGKTYRKETE